MEDNHVQVLKVLHLFKGEGGKNIKKKNFLFLKKSSPMQRQHILLNSQAKGLEEFRLGEDVCLGKLQIIGVGVGLEEAL